MSVRYLHVPWLNDPGTVRHERFRRSDYLALSTDPWFRTPDPEMPDVDLAPDWSELEDLDTDTWMPPRETRRVQGWGVHQDLADLVGLRYDFSEDFRPTC